MFIRWLLFFCCLLLVVRCLLCVDASFFCSLYDSLLVVRGGVCVLSIVRSLILVCDCCLLVVARCVCCVFMFAVCFLVFTIR